MKNLNLFLAVFWLALGAGLIVWHWVDPEAQILRIRGTNWSPGWVGIVLGIYNLVRWYSVRSSYQQQAMMEEQLRQRREQERERRHAAAEYNPAFDFSNPQPPPEPEPRKEENREG